MSHHRKELKRIKRTRKLLASQQGQLRKLHLEGVVTLTFTTTTRSLTLPAEGEAVAQAVFAYYEHLRSERIYLREQANGVREQMVLDKEIGQQQRAA